MLVTRDQWKQLYAVFDPSRRLEATDDDLFVIRPGAVAREIADDLQLEVSGKWVVCGTMGSGKSSELAHLGGILKSDYAVIGLDLPNTVASIDRIQPAEVLFLIGLAAIRAARELWNHKISDDTTERLLTALKPLLDRAPHEKTSFELQPSDLLQGIALFAANVAAPGQVAVAGAAGAGARAVGSFLKSKLPLHRPTPLSGITRPVHEGEPDLVRLQEAVDRVLDEVADYRPPIVLVDGLDKIQELTSIRRMFSSSRILSLPRRPVVYAAPITLMLATEWQAAGGQFQRKRLTNVVTRRPELAGIELTDAKIAAGRDALTLVIAKRLELAGLSLGEVFAEGTVDVLIETSGGLLRDLIHLVNRTVRLAFTAGAPHATRPLADAAVSELRKEYEITMNGRRREELAYVRTHGEPSGKSDVSPELLLGGYILPYSNGRIWFEPHPILRDGIPRP